MLIEIRTKEDIFKIRIMYEYNPKSSAEKDLPMIEITRKEPID